MSAATSAATVRVGLTLPSFVDDPEVPLRVARAADAAGLDAVFAFDHLFRGEPPRPALECFALLGAVAGETARVALGPLVARATLRPAATLAYLCDTVQRVSGGRLIAGVGAGDRANQAENEAVGLPFGSVRDRLAALRDAVRALVGRGYPVWVGGRGRHHVPIVAEAGGWNCWGGTPEEFAAAAAAVREAAPGATLTRAGLVLLGSDEAEARRKATGRDLSPDVVVGGPERVAETLRGYVDRGASWLVLAPVDSSDPDNAALVGERLLPLLRA